MHRVMYPVACPVVLPTSSRQLIADLERDTLYTRSFYEVAQMYLSIDRSRSSSQAVGLHMQAALRTLQAQLAATNSSITNALVFTVLMLGWLSQCSNDIEAAQTHLQGLSTLIAMRGSLSSHKAYLQIKCCRLDLRVALQANRKPILIPPDTMSWVPCLSHLLPALSPPLSTPLSVLCTKSPSKTRLQAIYLDSRAFAQQLILAQQTKRKVSPQFFQDALISILYRLLHIDTHQGCKGTCGTLRMAMLAIGASVMLSGRAETGSRYVSITARTRECLDSLEQELQERQQDIGLPRAALWLEILAGLTVLGAPEEVKLAERRVQKRAKGLGLTSWAQTRLVLKEFVWIDALHDGPGSKFWDNAMRRQSHLLQQPSSDTLGKGTRSRKKHRTPILLFP